MKTRRFVLKAATAAAALSASSGALAQSPRHREVIERIEAFAAEDLRLRGFPGMTLALVGPHGFSAVIPVGLSDISSGAPVTAAQLFQVGSITKAFTALTLFVLADRGEVSLDQTVQSLLPDHPLPPEPITLVQLMEHSSGLPRDAPLFPDTPGGRLWTGYPPGDRYTYCNLGYRLLGAVIEKISGMTCGRATEMLVLRPLGMTTARPTIRFADRGLYASGHDLWRQDLPWSPEQRLEPGRWSDYDLPSGSVGAAPADMIAYMRFLIALEGGRGQALLSSAMSEQFRTPTIESRSLGEGGRYGAGLIHLTVDGHRCLRHTGGMAQFTSAFTVETASGVGCFAGTNVGSWANGYRPTAVTEYACALLRAVALDQPLPEVRRPADPWTVPNAPNLVGRWAGADKAFEIVPSGAGLLLRINDLERRLVATGAGSLTTDHPGLGGTVINPFPGRDPVLRVGDQLYGRGTIPSIPPKNPRLAPLEGSYASQTGARIAIAAVGDRLFAGGGEIVEADGRWGSVATPCERAWFEDVVDGRPQTFNASGLLFTRAHESRL